MNVSRDRTQEFYELARYRPPARLHIPIAITPAEQKQMDIDLAQVRQRQATNPDQLLHWCEVERLADQRRVPQPRATRMQGIHRQIETVSSQFELIGWMLARQSTTLAQVERQADAIVLRVDASRKELEDAAPRIYHNRRRICCRMPTTVAGRAQILVLILLALNYILFVLLL